jgi:hypothetical protein
VRVVSVCVVLCNSQIKSTKINYRQLIIEDLTIPHYTNTLAHQINITLKKGKESCFLVVGV